MIDYFDNRSTSIQIAPGEQEEENYRALEFSGIVRYRSRQRTNQVPNHIEAPQMTAKY